MTEEMEEGNFGRSRDSLPCHRFIALSCLFVEGNPILDVKSIRMVEEYNRNLAAGPLFLKHPLCSSIF